MTSEGTKVELLANPAPVGLMGFGVTTILLNLANAGFYGVDSMLVAVGIFYGGIAQIIAGIMEFRRGNTFGTTAFLSFGLFWESFVFLLVLPKFGIVAAISPASFGAYLFIWGLFTLMMFIGTLRMNGALMTVFASLFILFFLLAAAVWSGNHVLSTLAGYEGVFCGLSAMYASAAILDDASGNHFLSLFPVKPKKT